MAEKKFDLTAIAIRVSMFARQRQYGFNIKKK